jgi:hypothetical protein
MNNTNSYIMRDQVSDVVKSLMEDNRNYTFSRYITRISIIALTVVSFSL